MRRAASHGNLPGLILIFLLMTAFTGCGGGTGASQTTTSGLKFRAFVSNPFQLSGGGGVPILNIVDTTKDALSGFSVSLSGQSQEPNQMVLSPSKNLMMVYSEAGATISVVDTARESIARLGNSSVPAIHLAGPTESFFVAADNSTAYVAVPTAPTSGNGEPGQVEVLSLTAGGVAATVDVPAANFVVGDATTNRVVTFSNNSDLVTIISTSLIGSNDPGLKTLICIAPFANCSVPPVRVPVQGILGGDGTKLFILDCGPECGGTSSMAGVQVLDLTTNTVSDPVSIAGGATVGRLLGNTLYVAGTAPGTTCTLPSGTVVGCGTLTAIDVSDINNPKVVTTATVTDGHHDHLEMGTHGQLFVGSRGCTNLGIPGQPGDVRGCLAIVDTTKPTSFTVNFPATTGDVTGLQQIPNRDVVYVAQNGELEIYDTVTLLSPPPNENGVDIVGQANDVKIVY